MKKAMVLLVSLLSASALQAKTLDQIGRMTVAEFAEYMVSIPKEKVADEIRQPVIDEYGANQMSDTVMHVFWSYQDQGIVDNCNNLDKVPKKQRDTFKKECKTKMSEKIELLDELFRKEGLLK